MVNLTAKDIAKTNELYHDFISSSYDKMQDQHHPKMIQLYKELFAKVFRHLKKNHNLNIVDIGCGAGYMEKFLYAKHNQIDAFDISRKLISIAKKKFPEVNYEKKDLNELKIRKKYDIVVENSVLHHLKDYSKVLEEMINALKPHGCLFLGAEPNYYCYHYLKILKRLYRKCLPDKRQSRASDIGQKYEKYAEYHMYFSDGFNPFTLKKYLLSKGFKKVEIRFSSREFVASLVDRFNLRLIDYLPNFILDSTGILSRLFYVIAYK